MEKFLQKKWITAGIISLIMLFAFAVRIYNHEPWLYFKMDQARDAALIARAVENGPGYLPLLGPRAGATDLDNGFLRLGPIYYYFQYAASMISGSTAPEAFAYPDLFFGVAVLPLLYAFCRIYFKRYVSLLVALLYAFSFLVIEYSRFAWNPNPLPFFTILSFLALIKFLNAEEIKKKMIWIALWSSGLAIGSQLHFVGFFSLVGVSGLLIIFHFELWKKNRIARIFQKAALKNMALLGSSALAVFLFIYTPVIISDVMRGGENSRNFIEALSSKPSDKSFAEKLTKNVYYQLRYNTLVTTAFVYPKKVTPASSWPIILTLAIFLAGMYLAVKNIRHLSDRSKKDFLMLILLWFFVYFIFCTPLAYSIRPRFFIFTFAVPFLFLGLIFEFLEAKKIKHYPFMIAGLSAFIFFLNALGTAGWFSEQKRSQSEDVKIERTLILKNKDGVTLSQLQEAADFMYEKREGDNAIYFYVKPEHVRPIKYILAQEKDQNLRYFTLELDKNPALQYFAVIPSHQDPEEALEKKYGTEVEILSSKKCGQISVYEIDFPARSVSGDFRYNKDYAPTDRIFWRDVLGGRSGILEEEKEESMEDIDMNE